MKRDLPLLALLLFLGCKPVQVSNASSERAFAKTLDPATIESEFERLVTSLSKESGMQEAAFLDAVYSSQKGLLGQGGISLLGSTSGRCIVALSADAERDENSETIEWKVENTAIGYSKAINLPVRECQSFFERELGSTENSMYSFYNYKFN
ncbi:MAG: hypothetical protein AB7T49_16935 [Oligoflexales bacterium]